MFDKVLLFHETDDIGPRRQKKICRAELISVSVLTYVTYADYNFI